MGITFCIRSPTFFQRTEYDMDFLHSLSCVYARPDGIVVNAMTIRHCAYSARDGITDLD